MASGDGKGGYQNLETEGSRYLSFSLSSEEYAIPLLAVKEVIAVPEITKVPFTPSYFLGVMNLRGRVISVIDLRRKFNVEPSGSDETAIIICDFAGMTLGVVVDAINSVLFAKKTDLSPTPDIHSAISAECITNIYRTEKRLILFLDIVRALSPTDTALVSKAGEIAA